jgi:hypothetical protein
MQHNASSPTSPAAFKLTSPRHDSKLPATKRQDGADQGAFRNTEGTAGQDGERNPAGAERGAARNSEKQNREVARFTSVMPSGADQGALRNTLDQGTPEDAIDEVIGELLLEGAASSQQTSAQETGDEDIGDLADLVVRLSRPKRHRGRTDRCRGSERVPIAATTSSSATQRSNDCDDGCGQDDKARALKNPESDSLDAGTPAANPRSYGCSRNTDAEKKGQQVEMVYDHKILCFGAGRPVQLAPSQRHDASCETVIVPDLARRNDSSGTLCEGGVTETAAADQLGNIAASAGHRTGSRDMGSTAFGLGDLREAGLHPPAEKGGRYSHDPYGQRKPADRNHLPQREGCNAPRSGLHGSLGNSGESQDKTAELSLPKDIVAVSKEHRQHESDNRPSESRHDAGIPKPSERRIATDGIEPRRHRRGSDVVQRSFVGKNLEKVFELGNKGAAHSSLDETPCYQADCLRYASIEKQPRFINFLGVEAPSIDDLRKTASSKHLPLHMKPNAIGTISYSKLWALSASEYCRSRWFEAMQWITNDELLSKVSERIAPPRKATNRLNKVDVDLLTSTNKWAQEPIPPISLCNVFAVSEWWKNRRRMIIEPLLNDKITKKDLLKILLPTKRQIRRLARHRFVVQFDASAFYDQFVVAPKVRRHFGVKTSRGFFVQNVLGMGYRPACAIAQTTAELLISFELDGVTALAYIDNFIFGSDNKEALEAAVKIFLERCKSAGVVLNSSESLPIADEFDCLGEHYRCGEDGTRSLTENTIAKLGAAVKVVQQQTTENISFKQLSAVYGILFYASAVIDLPICQFRTAVSAFRNSCVLASINGWDSAACRLSSEAFHDTMRWLSLALLNKPVPLSEESAEPVTTVYVDASEWGFGGVVVRPSGATELISVPWALSDGNLQSSVLSEPLAAFRVLLMTIRPDSPANVNLYSDHAGLVFAGKRGWAKAASYNECLRRLNELLPLAKVQWNFIAGVCNPADKLSRGEMIGMEKGMDLDASHTQWLVPSAFNSSSPNVF